MLIEQLPAVDAASAARRARAAARSRCQAHGRRARNRYADGCAVAGGRTVRSRCRSATASPVRSRSSCRTSSRHRWKRPRRTRSLLSAAVTALQAAAAPIEPIIELEVVLDYAGEIATETLLTSVNGAFVTTPILEDDELDRELMVVRIVEAEPAVGPRPPDGNTDADAGTDSGIRARTSGTGCTVLTRRRPSRPCPRPRRCRHRRTRSSNTSSCRSATAWPRRDRPGR